VDSGEVCDQSYDPTPSCENANGDTGQGVCQNCQIVECTANCSSNAEYGDDRCCIAVGPDSIKRECYGKGIYSQNSRYLCDPGVWMICDENNAGSRQEFENRIFICSYENGSYALKELSNIFYEIIEILSKFIVI
jgi:hypothetical protein